MASFGKTFSFRVVLGLSLAVGAGANTAIAAATGADASAGPSCDRLAAFNDGRAPSAPVKLSQMDGPAALSACRAAAAAKDAPPRHHFQLARALIKTGRPEAARKALERAILEGGDYPAAAFVLGQLFHTGTGVTENPDRAHELYSEAYAGGYTTAVIGLLMLYEDPASGYFDPQAAASARLLLGWPTSEAAAEGATRRR